MKELKVILVDDSEPFRKAFRNLIVKEFNAKIVGEASNSEEFERLENYPLADLIFMDLMMPGTDGITLTKKTLWKFPNLYIIAITMHIDQLYLELLLSAGFRGCISKNDIVRQLDEALTKVMNGELHFPANIRLDYVNHMK